MMELTDSNAEVIAGPICDAGRERDLQMPCALRRLVGLELATSPRGHLECLRADGSASGEQRRKA